MRREAITMVLTMVLAFPAASRAAEGNSVPELYRLSYAAEGRGDLPAAIQWMDEVARQGDASYVLHLRRGWLLHLARRPAESAASYAKAIELEPRAVEARLGAMVPLMAQRRWKEAEKQGLDVLSLAPGDFTAQSRVAFIQYTQGFFEKAEAAYRGALAAYPGNVEMRAGLAWSLLRQRRMPEARAEFEKVLRIAPDHPSANEGVGQL
jgi:tetratricopeptide (TPR) repeat protein